MKTNKTNIKDKYKKYDSIVFIFAIFITTIFGAFLRIRYIDHHSLWFDEGYTVLGSINNIFPWKDFLSASTGRNLYPPLEFLLHHFVIKFFGISDITVRIVPCFFGIMAIPLLGVFGKKISNTIIGICASLLIAFSPLCVYLSSEARYYSHIIFAIIVYGYVTTLYIEKQNVVRTVLLLLAILYIFNISLLFFEFKYGFIKNH